MGEHTVLAGHPTTAVCQEYYPMRNELVWYQRWRLKWRAPSRAMAALRLLKQDAHIPNSLQEH